MTFTHLIIGLKPTIYLLYSFGSIVFSIQKVKVGIIWGVFFKLKNPIRLNQDLCFFKKK